MIAQHVMRAIEKLLGQEFSQGGAEAELPQEARELLKEYDLLDEGGEDAGDTEDDQAAG